MDFKSKKIHLKFGTLTWLLLLSGLAAWGIYIYSLKEREKNIRIDLERKLSNISRERMVLEDELKKISQEKGTLEKGLEELRLKIEKLNKDLDSEKKAKEEILAKLEEKEKALLQLKEDVELLHKEKSGLEAKLKLSEAKIKSLENELISERRVKEELEKKLNEIMQRRLEVELEKVIVKPKERAEARILAVNHDYQFVVVNLGRQSGLTLGKVLGIYRGDELIAKVRVEKIYETMAVADILPEDLKGTIREEDRVQELEE